jgi:sulfite exporter TauE/SafE
MGLAGGPHCVAMCGAACAAMGGSAAGKAEGARSLWLFQLGRLAGYSAMGALAAASMQGLGWLSVHSASLRPVWSLLHVAAALLGLMLLVQARQPVWLELGARHVWSRIRSALNRPGKPASPTVPLVLGVAWSLLPCGLLYSALLVAALSANPAEGAGVMALFAVGSGLSLMAGPWLWLRLRGPGSGQWAIRLAGAALLASSAWALWMGLVHDAAPWCITP